MAIVIIIYSLNDMIKVEEDVEGYLNFRAWEAFHIQRKSRSEETEIAENVADEIASRAADSARVG